MISSLLAGQQEWFILLYPLVSLFAALASALVGFGGGIIMLVLLSPFTELKVLVALVAMVQLASLVFRFYIYRQGIDYRLTGLYLLGSFPGIVLAAWLFEAVNSQQLGIVLGMYLLYSAWRPDGLPLANSRLGIPLSASVMAFVSFFVGAPGPAIASLMSQLHLAKIAFLGTLSACLLGQTLMRLGAFFSVGVQLENWLVISGLMVMTSLAGSLAGQRLVTYLDTETVFRLVRILMLLAGLNLLYRNLW